MVKKKQVSEKQVKNSPANLTKAKKTKSQQLATEITPIAETFHMTRLEQLKCISVPIRLKILEAMAVRPMTTKQVALQLGESITGLYRHVEALAQAGLVILVDEVPKRGTVQKFYRSAAKRYVADDSCLPRVGLADPRLETILELVEATRRGILAQSQIQHETPLSATAASTLVEVLPEQYPSLVEAITDAIQNWKNKRRPAKSPSKPRNCRISIFVHPESLTANIR